MTVVGGSVVAVLPCSTTVLEVEASVLDDVASVLEVVAAVLDVVAAVLEVVAAVLEVVAAVLDVVVDDEVSVLEVVPSVLEVVPTVLDVVEAVLDDDELEDEELEDELEEDDELDPVVDVALALTGIVMIVVVGMLQVATAVITPFSLTVVVSFDAFSVTLPDAGAFAFTEMSGVVSAPGTKGPGVPIEIVLVVGRVAVSTSVWVAPPAVGASVAVPGFTIEPAVNVVFLIWYTSERFAYDEMVRPLDEFGSVAVPPGNVTVKLALGATASGAVIATETSCTCVLGVPLTSAVQLTPGKVFTIVCAPAGLAASTLNVASATMSSPEYTATRRPQLSLTT